METDSLLHYGSPPPPVPGHYSRDGISGRPLTALALERAIAFAHSSGRDPRVECRPAPVTTGDPLAIDALAAALSPDATLVHVIGTPCPSPAKAQQSLDVVEVAFRQTV